VNLNFWPGSKAGKPSKQLIARSPKGKPLAAEDEFESIVASAPEHEEDFDDLCDLFHITVDHDLNIKRNKKILADTPGLALCGTEPLVNTHQPDLVPVQGESTTRVRSGSAAMAS
jgi:UDP-N-acetylglucosamine 2-epimerase (non-hydrolysing)